MAKKKIEGECHICRAIGPLPFEHVPPHAAYNNGPAVSHEFTEWLNGGVWDPTGKKKEQRGVGAYTLCDRCNNNTGSWYGSEYVNWANQAFSRLGCVPPGRFADAGLAVIKFVDARPMRFIKQVVAMIFSANSPAFAEKNPALVNFVIEKHAKGLPSEYQVYMTLLRGNLSRMSGVSGEMQFDKGDMIIKSEIAHPPFGLVMTFDSPPPRNFGRITHFAELGYDERQDTTVLMNTGEIYSPYPDDNRAGSTFKRGG